MVLLLARIADKKRSSYWTNCVAGKAAGQPDKQNENDDLLEFFYRIFWGREATEAGGSRESVAVA